MTSIPADNLEVGNLKSQIAILKNGRAQHHWKSIKFGSDVWESERFFVTLQEINSELDIPDSTEIP